MIPSRAYLQVDCRVPPGLGEEHALTRIHEVLGGEGYTVDFHERVVGNASPVESELMDTIRALDRRQRRGRVGHADDPAGLHRLAHVPRRLPRTSIAYGFMPHRHMTLYETAPLIHSADERVDVRDLDFAARFFMDVTRELLG